MATPYQTTYGATIPEAQDMLEGLLDTFSLGDVLEMLRDVCYGKAEHVAEAWQDRALARAWERNGKLLDKAATGVVAVA